MKFTAKQVYDISQDLQVGMKVFINKDTFEIKAILDWDNMIDDTGFWAEELEKIDNEWTDNTIISKLESRESFQIMEEFIDEINDDRLKEDLIKILNRKSPFANFKYEVEGSSYRQAWFNFRDGKYEEYVKDQLQLSGFEVE